MKLTTIACVISTLGGLARGSIWSPFHRRHCCRSLVQAQGLSSKVYRPGSEKYEERIESFFSSSAALEPWCIVQPSTTEDVSVIMTTLVERDCGFGIRSGGHGAWKGSNSISNGVTVDFGNMNTTTYNPDTKLASLQPGGRWGEVYDTLAPYGITVTGGRVPGVGVGGFLLGGGNSFHSSSHGMACDTVANFEVVLANGSIVNANATSNSDLWVGLKGASGNLGLVTRFDMYAIDYANPADPSIWGGSYAWNLSASLDVMDAYVEFTDNMYLDENSTTILYWGWLPPLGGWFLGAAVENTLGVSNPPAFDGYRSVPGFLGNATRVAPMTVIAAELGQDDGFYQIWLTSSFKNDAQMMRYVLEKYQKLVAEMRDAIPDDVGFNSTITWQPLTDSMVSKGFAAGGNVMGLDSFIEGGNGAMFQVTVVLSRKRDEKKAYGLAKAFIDEIEAHAQKVGLFWGWKYLNYADGSQDPIKTYSEAAQAKMWTASAKYDPDGVFQRLRRSGHKL